MSALLRILLLIAAGLAAVIVLAVLLTRQSWEAPAPHRVDPGLFELPVLDSGRHAISNPAEIAERPLFSPTRRPPAVEVDLAEAPPPAESIDGARVHGLFGREGAWGVIISLDGKVSRLHVGEQLGQWTLQRIAGQDIEFSNRAGQQAVLKLRPLPVAAPPPAPAAIVPPTRRARAGIEENPPAEAAEAVSPSESQSE